jgi:hypothetical protein
VRMDPAHLTHVEHVGPKSWLVSCLCGWHTTEQTRREAIKAGEEHWAASPLVSEI